MKRQTKVLLRITGILLLGMILAWARDGRAAAEPNEVLLREKTEQLFLNYKILDHLYGDLREVTSAYIYQADEQLNYMQKITLFINEARLICYYQWQLFSIMDYIKAEAKKDYYTLRRKDLTKAKADLTFIRSLLDLYRTYIENKAALPPIDEAAANIEANVYLFERLVEILDDL